MKTENISPKILKEFGLITGLLLVCLFGLLFPWLFDYSNPLWPWIIAGLLSSLAIIKPMILKPVYRAWMKIGHILGWVNTRIILSIMFFIVFLPVGLGLKLLGKDPMQRTPDKSRKTYRETVIPPKKDHVERPY